MKKLVSFGAFGLMAVVSLGAVGCKKKDAAGADGGPSVTGEPVVSPLSGSFEGKIVVHVEGKRSETGPFDMDVTLKKDNVRIDVPKELDRDKKLGGGKAWGVFRAGEKKGFFAMEASKQAYTVDFDAAAEDLKKAMPMPPRGGGAGKPATPPPSIKRTGQKSVVAGIPCEEWEVKQDRDRALVCMAEESASWFKLPTKALPDDLGFAAEMIDGKHFPLRVVAFKGEGQEAKIEVKAIEKKTVADSELQVPAAYTQIDVVQMLKGLGGMGAMGAGGAPPGMMVPGAMPPGKVPTKPKK